jgi:ribosomal 50S subunit-recycling heat shock protein
VRLDLFLKSSRLILRRSLAQDFCDSGRVKVNGVNAKPSKEIKVGDIIEIRRGENRTNFKVLAVPTRKQVSKEEAGTLVDVVGESVEE